MPPATTDSLWGAAAATDDAPTERIGESHPTARFERPGFALPDPTLPLPLPGLPDPLARDEPDPWTSLVAGRPPSETTGSATDAESADTESTDTGPTDTEPSDAEPLRRMRGSIQRQEPGVTQPRPPTVGEARARDKARKRAEEAERAAEAALEAKRRRRKRMLIGGAAVVGVAAVVGAGYLAYEAATAPPDLTAYCITDDNGQQTVVNDDDCVQAQDYATSTGTYHTGLMPIFLYNGHQYRYYYGGSNTVGRAPTGGSTVAPSRAHVSTKSGTVVRGGLGSKSGGKSGGS
jgi:hypothetical protein